MNEINKCFYFRVKTERGQPEKGRFRGEKALGEMSASRFQPTVFFFC